MKLTATKRLWLADLLIATGVYTVAGTSIKTFVGSVLITWGVTLLADA